MKKWTVLMLALVLGGLSQAHADELADLKTKLEAQEKMISELKNQLDQLESRQRLKEKKMEKEVADLKVATEKPQDPKAEKKESWMDRINLSGDLRYRHETIDQEHRDERNRHRIRARATMQAKVADEWDLTLRIASGSEDPVSTNQTLDDSFSSKDIWLDQAFFTWSPTDWQTKFVGGKVSNPFYKAGKNQLIWDGDLNPEGIAASTRLDLTETTSLHATGGGFWIHERSSAADTSLWGIQGYVHVQHVMGNPTTLTAGASYYDYVNLKGKGDLASPWAGAADFFGNSNSGGNFVNDYNLMELFAELATKLGTMPVSVYGSYVLNTGTESGFNDDTGYLIGATLNKAKDPGSWELGYDYRDVEKDAVVGQFNDSDFIGGGTDGKGHRFGAKYQIKKNVQAAVSYFVNTLSGSSSDTDYKRLQLDLILKAK